MDTQPSAAPAATTRLGASTTADATLTTMRVLLLAQALLALVATIFLSQLAGTYGDGIGTPDAGAETSIRFAAGGTAVIAIWAAIASRGVRLARRWAWTATALLQVVIVVAITAAAMIAGSWSMPLTVGIVSVVLVTLGLATGSVRAALGTVAPLTRP